MADSCETRMLDEAVAGNQDALSDLLLRYGPMIQQQLSGKIDRRLRSVLCEEDVMQETYLDAFVAIGDFQARGIQAFTSWLATIAHRNLVDAVRELKTVRQGHGRTRLASEVADDDSYGDLFARLTGSVTTPSRRARRAEIKQRLEEALQQLPPTYREAIVQLDLLGRSAEEVASICGCRIGAMHMRRLRGFKLLKSALRSFTDREPIRQGS